MTEENKRRHFTTGHMKHAVKLLTENGLPVGKVAVIWIFTCSSYTQYRFNGAYPSVLVTKKQYISEEP